MTVWIVLLGLLAGALMGGTAWYAVNAASKAKDDLADLLLAQPQSAAVVAYTFDDKGQAVDDGYAIFHNADNPQVTASMMKIVVLAAYAQAVAQHDLLSDERISVADWERYYLPGSDGGAHVTSLESVGLAAGEHGFAKDRSAAVTLDDLARFMIHFSENAATDYLIERLGSEQLAAAMLAAGLRQHSPLGPTLGLALAALNHENPTFDDAQLQRLVTDAANGQTTQPDRLVELYLHDAGWRQAQLEFMATLQSSEVNSEAVWAYQVIAGELMPRGTAREYAQMMAKVASGQLLSPEASEIMQLKLESVPSDWPLRLLFYERFGAKDGVSAGVLTLASYAVPKRGPLGNQPRVVVIMAQHLPAEAWAQQMQFQGHYLLPIDLAQASGAYDRLAGQNHN